LTAGLLQSPYFLDYDGFTRNEPEGLEVRGFSATSRLYPASDGWLYLHCEYDEDWRNLTGLPEFAVLSADQRYGDAKARDEHQNELVADLTRVFSAKSRKHWIDLLVSAGVSAIENLGIPDFRDDPSVRQAGLIATREHPGRGRVDHLGTTVRLTATPVRLGRPSPILGADTQEILREVGYSDSEIDALLAARAAVQTFP